MKAAEATNRALGALTATQAPRTTETLPTMPVLAEWMGIEPWHPQIARMLEECYWFARDMREGGKPRWLSLLGTSGTGKTHCARRIWSRQNSMFKWSHCGYSPSLIKWSRFLGEQLRSQEFGQYRDMMRWPLLVLDDIGSERDFTGFATEQLVTLLDARERKWTIITSNLLLDGLAAIDRRIASRMLRHGSTVVSVTCEDWAKRSARLVSANQSRIS